MSSVVIESERFDGVLVLSFRINISGETITPVNVGFSLQELPPAVIPGAVKIYDHTLELDEGPVRKRRPRKAGDDFKVDAAQLESIVLDYPRYLEIARTAMSFKGFIWPSDNERNVIMRRARRKGRGRRGLDRAFFEDLAVQVKQRQEEGDETIPTTIAKMHAVDRSTASRWLKRLEQEGYLADEDA
jgi:hypothetical protein